MKCGMKVFLSRCHVGDKVVIDASHQVSVGTYVHIGAKYILTVRKVRSLVSTHHHHLTTCNRVPTACVLGPLVCPHHFLSQARRIVLVFQRKSIRSKDAFATSSAELWCTTTVLFRNDNGVGFVKPQARYYNRCSSRRGKI